MLGILRLLFGAATAFALAVRSPSRRRPRPIRSGPLSTAAAPDAQNAMPPTAAPADGAPAGALNAICTDRPTKSNYACTVDAGHVQYESDLLNGSFLRLNGVHDGHLLRRQSDPEVWRHVRRRRGGERLPGGDRANPRQSRRGPHHRRGQRPVSAAQVQLPGRPGRKPAGHDPALRQGAHRPAGDRGRGGGGRPDPARQLQA